MGQKKLNKVEEQNLRDQPRLSDIKVENSGMATAKKQMKKVETTVSDTP
jgi:hypothetical protein